MIILGLSSQNEQTAAPNRDHLVIHTSRSLFKPSLTENGLVAGSGGGEGDLLDLCPSSQCDHMY